MRAVMAKNIPQKWNSKPFHRARSINPLPLRDLRAMISPPPTRRCRLRRRCPELVDDPQRGLLTPDRAVRGAACGALGGGILREQKKAETLARSLRQSADRAWRGKIAAVDF